MFSAEQVAEHCTQDDCWIIIDGKVYDVTSYIPRHPGGAMIYVKAGGDCTHLFVAYHTSPRARYACLFSLNVTMGYHVAVAMHPCIGASGAVGDVFQ